MTNPLVLIMPNFEQPFVVETDASGYGLGAVLILNRHPLDFYSKFLGVQAQHKLIYENDFMVVCLAVKKLINFLMGRHFIIRTDQQSIKYTTQQREIVTDYQKWVRKLIEFDFEIQFKPGWQTKLPTPCLDSQGKRFP